MAGCDFTPSFFGMSHEVFMLVLAIFREHLLNLEPPETGINKITIEIFETFICILYLFKHGKERVLSKAHTRQLLTEATYKIQKGLLEQKEFSAFKKSIFTSIHEVGSHLWKIDVRNVVSESAKGINELVPHAQHLELQIRRPFFVVYKYWGIAHCMDASYEKIGGCALEMAQ